MIYYEISDLYRENINELELMFKLKQFEYIIFYAFICHDKTENVKPHYHILIQVDLDNKKAKSIIERDLHELKPFVKNVRNAKSFARYLTHIDYTDKEHYSNDLVCTNNRQQYNDLIHIECKKNKIENFILMFYDYISNMVLSGEYLSEKDIFKWWLDKGQGNYYICHRNAIQNIVNNIFISSDFLYEEFERREKINVNDNNNCSDYTIDNLI